MEFLVVKQIRHTGEVQWVAPKGHVEVGETREDAAIREVTEEVGYKDLNNIRYIGDQVFTYFEEGEENEKTVSWYVMEANPDVEPVLNKLEGFLDAKWLPYKEARLLFTHEEFRKWVDLAYQAAFRN